MDWKTVNGNWVRGSLRGINDTHVYWPCSMKTELVLLWSPFSETGKRVQRLKLNAVRVCMWPTEAHQEHSFEVRGSFGCIANTTTANPTAEVLFNPQCLLVGLVIDQILNDVWQSGNQVSHWLSRHFTIHIHVLALPCQRCITTQEALNTGIQGSVTTPSHPQGEVK